MNLVKRHIQPLVLNALKAFPVVYINGPRQVGKTTLVKMLLAKDLKAKFITFDDALERVAAMRNPMHYLKESGTPLIIDEVQRVPEIFLALKKLVDEHRQKSLFGKGSSYGCYLLTGSVNLATTPGLANAMVGRMATLTLLPLSVGEKLGTRPRFIERCFKRNFPQTKTKRPPLAEAIRRSSFPEPAISHKMIATWFKNYIQKITLEDPQQIYNLEKAEYMPLLLQSLALRAGNLVNDANIGREIGLNAMTTRNYRTLLENTFITHLLRPWYSNMAKRLVKSKKIYFYDTMLLCHLLGSSPESLMENSPVQFGHILENFVLSELMKSNQNEGDEVNISFYRTSDGREVDFVLEKQNKLVAVEVKNSENITPKDLAGIRELQQYTGNNFLCGVILCNTKRVIPYDKDIYLLPLSFLWG